MYDEVKNFKINSIESVCGYNYLILLNYWSFEVLI